MPRGGKETRAGATQFLFGESDSGFPVTYAEFPRAAADKN